MRSSGERPGRVPVFVLGVLVLAACLAWAASRWLTVDRAAAWVDWVRSQPLAPAVFAALAAALSVVKPTVLVPITGGILFGFWGGFVLTELAINAGAWTGFLASRALLGAGRAPAFAGRAEAAARRIRKRGMPAVALIRLVGFPPSAVLNAACGAYGIAFSDFAVGTFLGTLPWAVTVSALADRLWEGLIS